MAPPDQPRSGDTVEISVAELACRLVETLSGTKRAPGVSPQQALSTVDQDTRQSLLQCAHVAIDFVVQRMAEAMPGKVEIIQEDSKTDRPN